MKAKTIKESINFERGQDPKKAMDIGMTARRWAEKFMEETRGDIATIAEIYFPEDYKKIKRTNGFEMLPPLLKKRCFILYYFFARIANNDPSPHPQVAFDTACRLESAGQNLRIEMAEFIRDHFNISLDFPKEITEQSMNFERGMDPKKSMEVGIKAKVRQGMAFLQNSSRKSTSQISLINLKGDKNDLWVEILDYGTPDFEDFVYSCLSPEYFENVYVKAKPVKYANSWQKTWILKIKTQYKSAFRACFDEAGYLLESVNFERGLDPLDAMKIGRIEERKQKIIDEITDHDPLKWTGSSLVSAYVTKRGTNPWGWYMNGLHEESYEELKKILDYMRSWDRIDKKIFRGTLFDGPASTIQESVNFERGQDPHKAMKIGAIRHIDQLEEDYNRIILLITTQRYLKFQKPFSKEVSEFISNPRLFGWGNIQFNFKNMDREELYPFEQIVQKYTKILGLDESIHFERGLDPKESMEVGLKKTIINKIQKIIDINLEDTNPLQIYKIHCNDRQMKIVTNFGWDHAHTHSNEKYLDELIHLAGLHDFLIHPPKKEVNDYDYEFVYKFKEEYRVFEKEIEIPGASAYWHQDIT